jgi:hypothetical protein
MYEESRVAHMVLVGKPEDGRIILKQISKKGM